VRSGDPKLAATAVRLLRQVLTDEETLDSVSRRDTAANQAERNLDFVLEFLDKCGDELHQAKIVGLAELEKAAKAMEARFADAMPDIPNADYNEAGYLQKDLPPDESVHWGPTNNGLRVGLVLDTPVVLAEDGTPHSVKLIAQNTSDRAIRFHMESYLCERLQVKVTGPDGEEIRTEFGDVSILLPGHRTRWRLESGEKLDLCGNRLIAAAPEAKTQATEGRGMRSALTRLRATPGDYTAKYVVPLNLRRVIRGKNEWYGTLESSRFPIQVVAGNAASR